MQPKPKILNTKNNYRIIITISVMLATIMQALDSTIANVALPHMQGSLNTTQDQMTWVLTSYIVAAAITIPLTGWLAAHMGRKIVFLISIAGFVCTSILCGLAQTLPEMVLFRLLQGICGAALVPLSQAILLDINPPENHRKAMATWGIGVMIGPILGPVLGGWLTENYSWRWVFYINVPIGILAYLGLHFFLSETKKHKSKFDFFGFITLALGIGFLQIMLDRGELKDWFGSTEIIIEASIMAISFYLFVIHSLTYKAPFLDPKLFKDRTFVISNILIFVIGITLFATLTLVPGMLQHQMGYPVFMAGLITMPRGCGVMVAMIFTGWLAGRINNKLIAAIGLSLTAFSLWQMTFYSLLIDSWPIIWVGIIQGFGIGLAYISLSALAFSTLSNSLINEGTAFFNLTRNIGSSIGISMVESLLTRNIQIIHSQLSEHIMPYNFFEKTASMTQHLKMNTLSGLAALNMSITNQAAMIAYLNDYKLMMIITLCSIPLLFLLKKEKDKKGSNQLKLMD